jgi:hypothetical protein
VIGLVLLQVFRLPLPGPPVVTGSYGEIRGTTLHLGVDFGVGERIGEVPVLAAGAGYVRRIRVSHTGYGKVIHIQHPNGLRTVYGHLSHFAPQGEAIVRAEQDRQRRFEVELYLPPDRWPVKAGDTIGWAGNSGYSFGAHLHFEVRTLRDETLPPYAYLGLGDSVPPVFIRLGLVPLSGESAVEGRGNYYFFRLAQHSSSSEERLYHIRDTVAITGRVGVVYTVGDRMGRSRAWTGVAEVVLRTQAGDTLYRVCWDTLSYDWRRYVPWHVDEPYNQIYRVGVERLYSQGLEFPWTKGNGVIQLDEGEVRGYEVVARDFLGNKAVVRFTLRGGRLKGPIRRVPLEPARSWSVEGGLLLARKSYQVVFADGGVDSVSPTRSLALNGRVPLYLIAGRDTQKTHIIAVLYPGHPSKVPLGRGCQLEVYAESLPDTMYLRAYWKEGPWGMTLVLGEPGLHLRTSATLTWDLAQSLPERYLSKAVPIYRGRQGGWDGVSGYRLRGRTLEVPLRRWGSYTIMVDTLAPTFRPLRHQGPFYIVQLEDFGSGVNPYTLKVEALNCCGASPSTLYPEYYLPQHRLYIPREKGRVFRITVRDKVGNTRTQEVRF